MAKVEFAEDEGYNLGFSSKRTRRECCFFTWGFVSIGRGRRRDKVNEELVFGVEFCEKASCEGFENCGGCSNRISVIDSSKTIVGGGSLASVKEDVLCRFYLFRY
ncbi:hypothetical protein Droror1_Dr00009692 [Drosera rotundifolia]